MNATTTAGTARRMGRPPKAAGDGIGLALAVMSASRDVRLAVAERGGMTPAEIADVAGCTQQAVYALLWRALANARRAVKAAALEPEDFEL